MKRYFIFLFLLAIHLIGIGQSFSTPSLNVSLAAFKTDKPLPFHSIRVVDARSDTSKIGYWNKKKQYLRVTTSNGFANSLENLLNELPKEASADDRRLLVVIKKFWFREPTDEEIIKQYDDTGRHPGRILTCYAKVEFYLNRGEIYTPLFRFDSVFQQPAVNDKDELTVPAVEACLNRLEKLDLQPFTQSKTQLSWPAVEAYNRQFMEKSILTDFKMRRGVFITFNDFLQNKPRYTDFEVEAGAVDHLYVTSGGSRQLLTNFWGYAGSSGYFFKNGQQCYPLQRRGNTFEFVANVITDIEGVMQDQPVLSDPNSPTAIANGVITNGIADYGARRLLGNGRKTQWRTFQIDMETGKAY